MEKLARLTGSVSERVLIWVIILALLLIETTAINILVGQRDLLVELFNLVVLYAGFVTAYEFGRHQGRRGL